MRKICVFNGCQNFNFAHGYCSGHAAQIRRGQTLAPLTRKRPQSGEGFNWCSKCKQHKPIERFSQDRSRNGLDRVCHDCKAAYQREYNAKNKEKVALRVTLTKWGLTEEQYNTLFEEQDHKCAICGTVRRESRNLAIDHDHKTGRIRGLLCQDCNLGIGQLADDPDIVQNALDYLRSGGVSKVELYIRKDNHNHKRTQRRDKNRARNRMV